MSLLNISRDIISKANIEKDNILKELETVMSNRKIESNKKLELYKLDLKEKFDIETESRLKVIKGKAIGDSKKIILDSKAKVVLKTYENILNELYNLSQEDRKNLLLKLIKIAKNKIDYETIYCSKQDMKFIKNNSTVKIKESEINGLIFESKSKDEILNLTFEVIANDIFEKYENKIQEILFE